MKSKIYKVNPTDEKESKKFYSPVRSNDAEVTIGDKTFQISGSKNIIELQEIIRKQSLRINELEYQLSTLKRNQSMINTELLELKTILNSLKKVLYGDDFG